MSAMDAVFEVTELREHILTHLDPKSLLTSQRVSRTWNATINNSPILQKQMFLKPTTSPLDAATSEPSANSLFGHSTYLINIDQNPEILVDSKGTHRNTCPIEMHIRKEKSFGPGLKSVIDRDFHELVVMHGVRSGSAMLHPNASWRNMLVSQPPIKEITMVTSAGRTATGRKYRLSHENGLTLGMIWDAYWSEWRDLTRGVDLLFKEKISMTFSIEFPEKPLLFPS